jgi:xylan 1,4-beta-xylosidase
VPAVDVPAPGDAETKDKPRTVATDFDGADLPADFQWLRTPEPERLFSLTERAGHLRLFGRESIGSWFEFALVARRQEHHNFRVETVLEFAPETYQEVAGLTHYYNRYKFHALGVTWHEELGRSLVIQSCPGDYPSGKLSFPIEDGISVPDGRIYLAADVRANDLQFFWHAEGEAVWQPIGPVLDGGVVSDEGGVGEHGSFTGAFVGMFAYDITGGGKAADFDGFSYERL